MNVFTEEELIQFNELLLGRGMPVQQDGIGYNKADYSVCAGYFYGLSYAQCADLAKRLIKYTETQLKVDKEKMKNTAKYYLNLAGRNDKNNGISIFIKENETIISFRYNEKFIKTIKRQPPSKRRWNKDDKIWTVSNDCLIKTLKDLEFVGADVENSLKYAQERGFA